MPYTRFDKSIFALECIENLLTEGMSGLLQARLRMDLELPPKATIYSINTETLFDPLYKKMSYYGITTKATPLYCKMVVENIVDILSKINELGISEMQLQKYKNKVSLMIKQDPRVTSPSKYTDFYTPFVLWDHPLRSRRQEYNMRMRLTIQDVNKVFRQIFTLNNFLLIYSGKKDLHLA